KIESAAVISDNQQPFVIKLRESHDHRGRAAVFADIREGFLDNAGQLITGRRRQGRFLQLAYETRRNPGFSLELADSLVKKRDELSRPHLDSTVGLNDLPQTQDFIAQHLLN